MGTSGEGTVLVPPGRDPRRPRDGRHEEAPLPLPAAALPLSSGEPVIRAGSWSQPDRPRAGGATVAAAVAETRRGSPPRERGDGAAPFRGAPEGSEGSQRDVAVALLCCLSSLSSSQSSAAGLTWPERSSLRDGRNVGRPGTAPAPRHGRLQP